MLRAALTFFVLAVLAYALVASGIAGMPVEIGRILLVVFLVLAVIGVAIGLINSGRPKDVI